MRRKKEKEEKKKHLKRETYITSAEYVVIKPADNW